MPRVVIVGSGIAGIYLAHLLADAFEVVVVDPQDRHQFIIGVPMAMAGMVDFEQLLFPFTSMKKVQFVQSKAIGVEDRCVRIADGNSPRVCGRYLVLAPGALRIGSAEYWNVKGAQAIYEAVKKAPAVRFIVNEYNPVMGFQEIAYAIKARHPEKAVSVHVVYVSPDYQNVLSLWARWAREVGIVNFWSTIYKLYCYNITCIKYLKVYWIICWGYKILDYISDIKCVSIDLIYTW